MEFNTEETRRAAAVAAAGRIVVAAAFGVRVTATLSQKDTGVFRVEGPDSETCTSRATASFEDCSEIPEKAKLPIALAGFVAGQIVFAPGVQAPDIALALFDGEESAAPFDWGSAKTDYAAFMGRHDYLPIQQAIDAINNNRPIFDWCVAELMSEGVVTDGMVAEWIEKNGITRVDLEGDAA